MKKTLLQKLSAFRFGIGSTAAVLIVFFLIGYNATVAENSSCSAQVSVNVPPATPVVVTGGPCPSACATPPVTPPCEPAITSESAVNIMWNAFDQTLKRLTNQIPPYMATQRGGGVVNSGNGLEGYLGGIVDAMLFALMDRLNDIELGYMDWFDTMWYYGLKPALMDMTDQQNTGNADQNRTFQAGQDANDEDQVNVGQMEQEQRDNRTFRPSSEGAACPGAMAAGGTGRQQNLAKNIRKSMQKVTLDDGLNRKGTPSAKGRGAKLQARSSTYEDTFCDPDDNDGGNNCTGTPVPGLFNADAQITKTLYATLTIPLHDGTNGPKYEAATKALLDNLTGDPTPDPMSQAVMKSAQAQQEWVDRRSYLARMAAIRTVPQLGIAWRTPGTRLSTWVSQLRQGAGAQPGTGPSTGPSGTCSTQTDGSPCEMSDNPSYKEVLHAISVDRFNSGKYANGMITDETDMEMEKLTLESFYLMQLRDYYELLERMSLTLAVQVAILADQAPNTVPLADRPR
ncbi:MAG TPA: hypothetical protein VEF76_10065 [Patescibacteria group bacterium]|nr:hypothetical protein [Patescibacteria group bacterium]